MKTLSITLSSALLLTQAAGATDINLSVQVGGSNSATVTPGATVNYDIVAELSDAANEGLAFFSIDLSFEGGALSPAANPTTNPIMNFDRPAGMTNPQGFGGTAIGGDLVQIGGAQNTWLNFFAPVPNGTVITNVAKPGTPVVLASGTLTAPNVVGDFVLSAENIQANVIRQGETGSPFWAVDAAGIGSVSNLTVTVSALSVDLGTVSISTPVVRNLSLDAGALNGGRAYLMLGSISGTSPGQFILPGIVLPLNIDIYTTFTVEHPNTATLGNSMGNLDAQGHAVSTFKLPNGLSPTLAGLVVNHAYLLLPVDFVSEAEAIQIVP